MTPVLRRKFVITVAATVLFLGWDIRHRIMSGITVIRSHSEAAAVPSVLLGMKLTRAEADFFANVNAHIESVTARHPTLRLTTLSPDGMYAAFSWGERGFGKFPVYWPLIAEKIYPESGRELCSLIESRQAIVIASADIAPPPGYCQLGYESIEADRDTGCSGAGGITVNGFCPHIRTYHCRADTRSIRLYEPCGAV